MVTTTKDKRRTRIVVQTDDLIHQLKQYDRQPFLDLLAEYMKLFPSKEALLRFADAYPDRYMGALAQLARIGGFTDKTESSVNINVNLNKMSDSQLEDRMREMSSKLGLPLPDIIDITPTEMPQGAPKRVRNPLD